MIGRDRATTVLIADDEPHILRIVALKLSRAGFEVLSACNGRLAWEALERERVDLLISDYQMPELNGLDLAQKMYFDERFAQIPILLLTAKSFSMSQQDMQDTNITALISKPFSPRDLLAQVKATVEGSNLEPVGL